MEERQDEKSEDFLIVDKNEWNKKKFCIAISSLIMRGLFMTVLL